MLYRSHTHTQKQLSCVLPLNNPDGSPRIHEPKPFELRLIWRISFYLNSENFNMKLLIKLPQRCITPSHRRLDTSVALIAKVHRVSALEYKSASPTVTVEPSSLEVSSRFPNLTRPMMGCFPNLWALLYVAARKEPIEDMLEMILFLMWLDKPFYLTHLGKSITFYNLLYLLSYFQGQPAVVQFSAGATPDVTKTTMTSAAPLHLNSC